MSRSFLGSMFFIKGLLYNIPMRSDNEQLLSTVAQYSVNTVTDIRPLGNGHINVSFLVTSDTGSYVLQCLNNALYADHLAELEGNYLQYHSACERAGVRTGAWICPEWLKSRSGQFFHKDPDGKIWRLYRYIPGDTSSPAEPFEAGEGLGRLHKILRRCDKTGVRPVLPGLHDLKSYYDKYLAVCDGTRQVPELDRVISDNIEKMLDISVPADTIIHGDAKISNMIMRDGQVIGFIDLDTMMPGSPIDDLADCIRSCCIRDNGKIDTDMACRLLDGYETGAETELMPDMRSLALMNVQKNRFMLGLRYYTDHLTGKRYFTESYPGQNLQKARLLLLEPSMN